MMGTPLQCPPPCLAEPPNQSSSSSIFSAPHFISASPSLTLGSGFPPEKPQSSIPSRSRGRRCPLPSLGCSSPQQPQRAPSATAAAS